MEDNSCDGFAIPGGSNDDEDSNSSNTSNIPVATSDATGRSSIWKYFRKTNDSAKCNLCLKVLKATTSSTTALWRHLRHVHPNATAPGDDKTARSLTPLEHNSTRAKEITQSIAEMIIWDLEPYSIVEHWGFRALMNKIEPQYVMPDRTTFSRSIIPNLYDTEKARIKQTILRDIEEGVSVIALTTDGWTSRAIESYISVTLHYVTNDFKPRRFTLAMAHVTESHTSKNLHDILETTIRDWGLDTEQIKSIFFTTDNAANIVGAIRMGKGWFRIPCFAHTLQLAVKDIVKESAAFGNLCRKAQSIVSYFARSTSGHAKLDEAQKNLMPERKPLKLIQNVDTRWNSQYDMFARLLALRKALSVVLCDRGMPSNLTETEWNSVEEYVEVLGPVKDATVIMSSDTYPTLSQYIPIVETLKKAGASDTGTMDVDAEEVEVEAAGNVAEENSNEGNFADSLSGALEKRFHYVNGNNDAMVFAMILDPRFKDRFLSTAQHKHEVTSRLKWKAALLYADANVNVQLATGRTARRDVEGQPKSKLLKLFETFLDHDDNDDDDDVERELQRYLVEKVQPRDTNVFQWWAENQPRFPILAHVAKQYLNIPAAQTTSERLFSVAGNVVTQKRAQLLSCHVEQLTFLHENYGQQ